MSEHGSYLPGGGGHQTGPDPSGAADSGFTAAMSRNELFADLSLPRLEQVLQPGERVLLALPAVASETPKALIVTDSRVVLAQVTGLRNRPKTLRSEPAPRVRGISFGGGAFSRVHIHVDGARDIRMMPHRKHDAARFTREFEQLLHGGAPRP